MSNGIKGEACERVASLWSIEIQSPDNRDSVSGSIRMLDIPSPANPWRAGGSPVLDMAFMILGSRP